MKFRRIRSIVIGYWVLTLSLAVSAQEPAAEGEVFETVEDLPIQFRVMAFGDDYFEDIRFEDQNGLSTVLDFNPYRRSLAYYHPEDERILVFFREFEDERGKTVRQNVARVDLSEITSKALLMFSDFPDGENQLQYTITAVDESEEAFGPGSFRFLNLSGATIALLAGDQERILLKAGFSDAIQFDVEDRVPILFRMAVQVRGDWKSIFATRRQSHEQTGTLFILKPPFEENSMKIRVNVLVESLD